MPTPDTMSSFDRMSPLATGAMRLRGAVRPGRIAKLARWALIVLAMCSVAPEVLADDLVQTFPSLGVSATALSLTLVTAAGRFKK